MGSHSNRLHRDHVPADGRLLGMVDEEQEKSWERSKRACLEVYRKRVDTALKWALSQPDVNGAIRRIERERSRQLADAVRIRLKKNDHRA